MQTCDGGKSPNKLLNSNPPASRTLDTNPLETCHKRYRNHFRCFVWLTKRAKSKFHEFLNADINSISKTMRLGNGFANECGKDRRNRFKPKSKPSVQLLVKDNSMWHQFSHLQHLFVNSKMSIWAEVRIIVIIITGRTDCLRSELITKASSVS